MKLAVVNGPNLNLLGTREPDLYGSDTLADMEKRVVTRADELGVEVEFFQSNHEGALIDFIQATSKFDGFILNPGGYGHTSVALADAISGVGITVVEVHVTNIHAREEFRSSTYSSRVAAALVSGLGIAGYVAALEFLWARKSGN
jgi:3-dehydroquinate dehydratase-2